MAKLSLKKPPGLNLAVIDSRPVIFRRDRYQHDVEFRARVRETSRRHYRRVAGVEMESCLISLKFFEELATTEPVIINKTGKTKQLPVFNIPKAALVMQKNYQTFWRWVRNNQLPAPCLSLANKRREPAYHLEEMRIFIEEIGNHEKVVKYYRSDHTDVKERIFSRVTAERRQLGIL